MGVHHLLLRSIGRDRERMEELLLFGLNHDDEVDSCFVLETLSRSLGIESSS